MWSNVQDRIGDNHFKASLSFKDTFQKVHIAGTYKSNCRQIERYGFHAAVDSLRLRGKENFEKYLFSEMC